MRGFSPRFTVGYWLGIAAIAAAPGCDDCGGSITPKESFVLAFADATGTVRVRTSDDGRTWASSGPTGAVATDGVGLSSSNDGVGVVSVLARRHASRLKLRFGLGAANWDSTDVNHASVDPRGKPTFVDIGDNHYLVAFLGGSDGRRVFIRNFDKDAGTFTDITPTLGGIRGDNASESPEIIYDSGKRRLLAAWRFGAPDGGEVQLAAADVGPDGAVTWTHGYVWDRGLDDPSYSIQRSGVALAHDQVYFYIGLHQNYVHTGSPPYRLSLYVSQNAVDWTAVGALYGTTGFAVPTMANTWHIQMARMKDCTMLAAFVHHGAGDNQIQRPRVFRRDQVNNWHELDADDVFGPDAPPGDNAQPFTLLVKGRVPRQVTDSYCV